MSLRTGPFVISVILLFAAWLMLTSSLHYQELIAGIIVSFALGFALNSVIPEGGKGNVVRRTLGMGRFLLVLAWEMIKANLDVAYRVLSPKMPIRPGIVKVRPGLESDMGRLLLSNAITLTPGTLSLDWDEDDLYIHWINVDEDNPDSSMEPLDRAVRGVFR